MANYKYMTIPKELVSAIPTITTIDTSHVDTILHSSIASTSYTTVPKIKDIIIVPKIKDVIISGNATIVFWMDDTKTIVRRSEDDEENYEAAIAYAYMEKVVGTKSQASKIRKRFIEHALEVENKRLQKKGKK